MLYLKAFLVLTVIFNLSKISSAAETRPRGIFIQVSSANTYVLPWLDKWLARICQRNSELDRYNTMNDLVLTDVGEYHENNGSYTMRWEVLDKIVPFVAGGEKQCFGNVFVGTISIPSSGGYTTAMKDPAYIQKNVDMSRTVAREFATRYPKTRPIHWYVSHEGVVNYFTDPEVSKGYEELFVGLIKEFNQIQQGAVMWSPAFWRGFHNVSNEDKEKIRVNMYRMFTNTRNRAPPGVSWMNLQDTQGRGPTKCSGINVTWQDAVDWYKFLKDTYSFRSIQMNEELFTLNEDCQYRENPAEKQIEREEFYTKQGVRLGAAFEIRYWRERWAGS